MESFLHHSRTGPPMISPFLFNGCDEQNAATNLILREKAALLSIHGLAEHQANAIAAQQAALIAQQNVHQQQQTGQTNQTGQSPSQTALVNTLNNSFALQSSLLANGSNSINALNNLNNLSAMSNSNLAAVAAAAAASSLCSSPTQSAAAAANNKMLWRSHPAFQQEVYNLLAALPWYSAALGNFKTATTNNLTNSSTTDQQMAALHQFWSQNSTSNQLALGNNGLTEQQHSSNPLNSGPIRPTIHSAESILQTMNRYTPYSFKGKELQGDCN